MYKKTLLIAFSVLLLLCQSGMAQKAVQIDYQTVEHFFTGAEIDFLKDSSARFTIDDIKRADQQHHFIKNKGHYPESRPGIPYWYKIELKINDSKALSPAVIEFFDQTTNDIVAFMPTAQGGYIQSRSGAALNFADRLYDHKNFEFQLQPLPKGTYTCYFRVKPKDKVNIIVVYRTVGFFIHYALTEYLTYGLFYGIILIFSLHNLLMFLAVKKRRYLYYVFYILSVGLFEMSTDGIAFQYIWPNSPDWNQYAYGFALFSLSFFALTFTKELLHVHKKAPRLNSLINLVISLRSIYFVYCLLFNKSLFYYKFIEAVPLTVAFLTGVTIWAKGFKPARFFVVGYTFLCLGFLVKVLSTLGFTPMFPGVVTN
jgi:hypothetical protein